MERLANHIERPAHGAVLTDLHAMALQQREIAVLVAQNQKDIAELKRGIYPRQRTP